MSYYFLWYRLILTRQCYSNKLHEIRTMKKHELVYVGQCQTRWPPCRIQVAPSVQRRKVWLTPTARVPCSKAANARKPLKFAGVPQTPESISAVSGPKFAILWGHVEDAMLFNKFFRLSICAILAKIPTARQTCVMVPRWRFFWRFFASCIFQWATCSTFQTCFLNSH